ncbi:MAG: TraX family protein [Candidatus Pacebacteria bacterium]|nr:TraX family protein [Candidatus Paceibacterota bacterium]
MITIKKYFTTTQLKMIALALMFLDHIYEFFAYTGSAPVLLTMLGRLSLPLFIFCTAEGFYYTHDRKKYILRLFAFYLLMEALRYYLMFAFPRPDGFVIQNNIFGSILLTVLSVYCIDQIKAHKKEIRHLLSYSILLITIIPLTLFAEGGWFYIFLGIMLYYTRQSRPAQAACFVALCLMVWANDESIRWMMTFAVFFIILYNGKKGEGYKYFFYIFYPAHIALLYVLSVMLYAR